MMNPIYFPFTYVSSSMVDALKAFFKKISVYQVSDHPLSNESRPLWDRLLDNNAVEIRIPVTGDEKKIQTILKDYITWADLHKGDAKAFLEAQANMIPFFSETSVSKIKTDIKKRIGNQKSIKSKSVNQPDELFAARLFLSIAHEHDIHQFGVLKELMHIESMEKDLFDRLKGDPDDLSPPFPYLLPSIAEDPGNYMTDERIKAWVRLLFQDTSYSGIYVTGSRRIFDTLLDQSPEAEQMIVLDRIPIYSDPDDGLEKWKSQLSKLLNQMARDRQRIDIDLPTSETKASNDLPSASLSVYLIPGVDPKTYFNRFTRLDTTEFGISADPSYVNTVLCILDMNP